MAAECNVVCASGINSTFASIITWLIVLFGWFVVHKATLARDRRREKREACQKMCDKLQELQDTAINFHTAGQFDLRASSDLGQAVEQVILRLQMKPLSDLNIPRSRLKAIRQRITGQNVDKSDFSTQLADSEVILEIRSAVSDVVLYLDSRREDVWG